MKYVSQSVKKAFSILFTLADEENGIGLSNLSRKLGIHKTTLYRLLNSLIDLNIIEKKDLKYTLGMGLFELGSKVFVKKKIIDKIHPILNRFVVEINETVNLAELYTNKIIYLDKINSSRHLQIKTFIGAQIPTYCTALGKVMLASLPEQEMLDYISKITFEKIAKNTIVSSKKLIENLKEIKVKGYSIDKEEYEDGLMCVAVPLFIKKYDFCGAISVSGSKTRFDNDTIKKYAEKLIKYVKEIKEELD